ncbi:hypothetical protein [Streptomyces beigongshangae]|uniref:hypothetical protein n=1 Tax=Streptomyces beigongshangae TaxID=2841597 RepID=UPI001C853D3E|nr:hypothetical protein [Streptomyces sp. REN17]
MTATEPTPGDAVGDLRATLKWIIAAAAGTGTLLVGAGPLAAMGKLDDRGDVAAAFCGLALTVTGIGWIVWQASDALMPQVSTLARFDDPELADLRALAATDPRAFFGPYASLDELRAKLQFHDAVAGNAAVMLARQSDERRAKMVQQVLDSARTNADHARHLERRLLTIVHAWTVRHHVRRARRHAFIAMIVVVAGAVLFLTSVNDNRPGTTEKKRASTHTIVVPGSP